MKKYILYSVISIFLAINFIQINAQWVEKGDSIIVQTFIFDSIHTRIGDFHFPSEQNWERILMRYTLKCDTRTPWDQFNCGEWDYLTYTIVYDSTGRFDSTRYSQAKYIWRNTAPQKFAYTNTQPFDTYLYKRKRANIISTVSSNEIKLYDSYEDAKTKLGNPSKTVKMQFIINKDELNEQNQFSLSGLYLEHKETDLVLKDLKIKIENTVLNELSDTFVELSQSAKTVFHNDLKLSGSNKTNIVFTETFNRTDGSNLLVEISHLHGEGISEATNPLYETKVENNSVIYGATKGGFLSFKPGDYVDVKTPILNNPELSNQISISLWQYGNPNEMPMNSYIFEGLDVNNNRVVNAHLPWSNSRIYWDCGNDGTSSYDRIDKEADFNTFAGRWNHWVFTKNTSTGIMKIYLNGELWHEGSGKNRPLSLIHKFHIASEGRYNGNIDEFSIWKKELTAAEVQSIYKNNIKDEEDNINQVLTGIFEHLILYFKFDDFDYEYIYDSKSNTYSDSRPIGLPVYKNTTVEDIFSDIRNSEYRPAISLDISEYELQISEEEFERLENHIPQTLTTFNSESPEKIIPIEQFDNVTNQIRNNKTFSTVYLAEVYSYTYNAEGKKIDSVYIEAENILTNEYINWYSPLVQYEIERFITPYGIGLDLGPEGFTWVYDVTDFGPLLSDYVRLSTANTQELVDLQFIFIKGTPARNLNKIQYIWKEGGTSADIRTNTAIAPTEIKIDENSKMFRVKTRSSGHGFGGSSLTYNCGEFCERLHNLWVNDEKVYEWNGWQECGDNPVYPQGGTWLLDRADWCPAKEVNTYNHEITEYVVPGDVVNFNYNMEDPGPNFEPYGNYIFTGYLISYDDYNFDTDAAITDIIAPTRNRLYSRINPICGNPIIQVQNTGRNTINEIEFEYGLKDGEKYSYLWNGTINSLQYHEIELPLFNFTNNTKDGIFEAKLMTVNGNLDEYSRNNYAMSEFAVAPALGENVVINIRTNNYAEQQYELTVTRDDGTIVHQRRLGQFQSNTSYFDTLKLENGCYEMLFENYLGYGLDYWPIRQQFGSGFINIYSGTMQQTFKADFGNTIRYQFRVTAKPKAGLSSQILVMDSVDTEKTLKIYPATSAGLSITSMNIFLGNLRGFSIKETIPDISSGTVNLEFGDTMYVVILFEPPNSAQQKTTLQINTNDYEKPQYVVELIGNPTETSVKSSIATLSQLEISNNPVYDNAIISWNIPSAIALYTELSLYNITGNKLHTLYSKQTTGKSELTFNTNGLSSGFYFVVMSIEGDYKFLPFIIER